MKTPCLLLLTLALQAQPAERLPNQTWVGLAGPWKISSDDDPRFASPEFDDSKWRTIRLPGIDPGNNQAAVFWIRRTFQLPPGVDRSALALTLGKISEHYRIWINGAPVATVGDLTLHNQQVARARTFDLPALPDGPLTIAVRAVRLARSTGSTALYRFPDTGPYVITARSNAPRRAGEDWLGNLRARRSYDLLAAVACFTLGLILLLMYLGERSRLEVLYLALYGLVLAFRRIEVFLAFAPDATPWRYGVFLAPVLILLIGLFSLRIFGGGWRWLPAVLCAGAACAYASPFAFRGFQVLIACVLGACTLRARDLSGRILAAALWLLFVSQSLTDRTSQSFAIFQWLLERTSVSTFGFNSPFHPIYTVVFLLAMVLVLTRRSLADHTVRQRLQGELEAARTVQQLLLPADATFANVDAAYLPAAEVGGDFWQALPTAEGGQIVITGDVSGKGLRAAMIVSLIVGAFRNRKSDRPAEILAELNRVAASALRGGFVTAIVAHLQEGRAVIASAGHPAPYMNGAELDVPSGLPLGIANDAAYEETSFAITGPLTFVSDGVLEAASSKGELFGFDRTRDISTKPAREIADAARAWGQNDDITVVTVRRTS